MLAILREKIRLSFNCDGPGYRRIILWRSLFCELLQTVSSKTRGYIVTNGFGSGAVSGGGDNDEKPFENLDDYLMNPRKFAEITPSQLYEYLKNNGFNPSPLSGGNQKGIPFEYGGGFKINWDGDRILQYHPAGRGHHGKGAYWKISSGPLGTRRFDLLGNPINKSYEVTGNE